MKCEQNFSMINLILRQIADSSRFDAKTTIMCRQLYSYHFIVTLCRSAENFCLLWCHSMSFGR